MDDKSIIQCANCGKLLNVPADRGTLNVRCPYCQTQFIWTPNIYQKSKAWYAKFRRSHWPNWLKISVAVGLLITGIILAVYFQDELSNNAQQQSRLITQSTTHNSQLVRINYDDLIDKGTITHSGQTVGNLLNKIASAESPSSTGILSELQSYLEPFSFICNDIVTSAKTDDVMPYMNVVADYQAGSRQPAWAALFREGNYQLFVGNGKARLFLKGKNPVDLFNRHYSVVRHSLIEALTVIGADKMTVEVYAFQNDYPSRTITLDLNPHVLEVAVNQLGPKSKELPLADLADFFNQGIILEAAEITDKGDFYLYGTPSSHQTVATEPQSLEDFAVVYRSMFHCGNNPPYISLDRHEDNRYAKVNFGGLLEDTRVGSVVLEADKLFKTMSTGLDPNSRTFIKEIILKEVPGFLTEDERTLQEEGEGPSEIRYWFYPDHIQSATDGRLGVVQNYQFMADAERMDIKVALGRAQRDTIDHLNRNLADYTRVLPTYRELNTVGRMMAIVRWIQESTTRNQVDLDALLSVELSPFKTPKNTKKLLAITAEASANAVPGENIGSRRKVYSFDSLLESVGPSTDDKDILKIAKSHFDEIKDPKLIPSVTSHARSTINRMKYKLDSLQTRINLERRTVDQYNEYEIDRFNAMVREYNSLQRAYNNSVDFYKESGQGRRYNIHTIVSVSGGINLRPKDFAKPLQVKDSSPLIQRIRYSQDIVRSSPGKVSGATENAAKSTSGTVATNRLPRAWKLVDEQSTGDLIKRRWITDKQDKMSVEVNSKSGYIHQWMTTKEYFSETTVKPGRKQVVVATSEYPNEILATSADFSRGGTVVLHRGKKIELITSQRLTKEAPQSGEWIRSGQP